MPVADPHVVRRSAEELPEMYGPSFAYAQFFSPKNFRGLLNIVVPIGLLFFLVRIAWIRNWLLNKFPSGSGPDAESRARAWFEVKLIASSASERQEVVVSGKDPGYNETSQMFSESALCLLEQLQQGNLPFGVISPARAMGYALIDRLQKQGIRFERIS